MIPHSFLFVNIKLPVLKVASNPDNPCTNPGLQRVIKFLGGETEPEVEPEDEESVSEQPDAEDDQVKTQDGRKVKIFT